MIFKNVQKQGFYVFARVKKSEKPSISFLEKFKTLKKSRI